MLFLLSFGLLAALCFSSRMTLDFRFSVLLSSPSTCCYSSCNENPTRFYFLHQKPHIPSFVHNATERKIPQRSTSFVVKKCPPNEAGESAAAHALFVVVSRFFSVFPSEFFLCVQTRKGERPLACVLFLCFLSTFALFDVLFLLNLLECIYIHIYLLPKRRRCLCDYVISVRDTIVTSKGHPVEIDCGC